MSSKGNDIVLAAMGLGIGVYGFFWGFKRLRRKRLVENIPTSKVRSLALGLVEVIGRAGIPHPLTSPLTKTSCVYYRYLVEEYRSNGRSGSWVKIAGGASDGVIFWLTDETGKILVLPKGAELEIARDYKFTAGLGKPLPQGLNETLLSFGIKSRGFFGQRSLRFQEWVIRAGDEVYVLGTAKKVHNTISDHKKDLNDRLIKIKSDPKKMQLADTNKDGTISQDEWNAFVNRIEAEMILEQSNATVDETSVDVVIGKGQMQQVFIISDQSQKELITRLGSQAMLGVCGGPVLTVLCLAYLIWRISTYGF